MFVVIRFDSLNVCYYVCAAPVLFLAVAQGQAPTQTQTPAPAATPPDFYVNYKDMKAARREAIGALRALGKSLFDVKVGYRAVGAEIKKQREVIKQHRDSVEVRRRQRSIDTVVWLFVITAAHLTHSVVAFLLCSDWSVK